MENGDIKKINHDSLKNTLKQHIHQNVVKTSNNKFLINCATLSKNKQDIIFQEFIDEDVLQIDNSKKDNKVIGYLIDVMGFSKYNFLIFLTAALILFFSGVQEIMLSFQLSMILENRKLTEYHLALININEIGGYILSSLLVNIISNYISMKKSIILFCSLLLIFTGFTLLTLNYFLTSIIRFFVGFIIGILDIFIYLNLVETMPTKVRGLISGLVLLFFPLGQLIMGIFSYKNVVEGNGENNFTYLLLIPFIFLVCMLLFIIYIHDSPRHLIADNYLDEGLKAIQKISRFNNQNLEIIQNDNNKNNNEDSFIQRNNNNDMYFQKNILDRSNDDNSNINKNIVNKSIKEKTDLYFNSVDLTNKNNVDISINNKSNKTIENIINNDITSKVHLNIELENKMKHQALLLNNNNGFAFEGNKNIPGKNFNSHQKENDGKINNKENDIIKKGYRINNLISLGVKTISENTIESNNSKNTNDNNKTIFEKIKKIFKPKYKQITISLWICSFCTGFIFNGIFFMLPTTAPKLDPLHMQEVIISVAIELPSIFLASILIQSKKIGRLNTIKISYLFCLMVCVICLFIKKDHDLKIDCILKFFITIPTNILIIYTSEIYSSRIRTIGRSTCDFWKRIGNILAPFIVCYMKINFGILYTFYVFIIISLIQMTSSLYLNAETVGKRLDEIIAK